LEVKWSFQDLRCSSFFHSLVIEESLSSLASFIWVHMFWGRFLSFILFIFHSLQHHVLWKRDERHHYIHFSSLLCFRRLSLFIFEQQKDKRTKNERLSEIFKGLRNVKKKGRHFKHFMLYSLLD
jgi:hypothetical protein